MLNFWNKIEILSDESELLIYSPDSEKKVNEKPVKIGITVPIGDIVVSLETQVWIYDGRIQRNLCTVKLVNMVCSQLNGLENTVDVNLSTVFVKK